MGVQGWSLTCAFWVVSISRRCLVDEYSQFKYKRYSEEAEALRARCCLRIVGKIKPSCSKKPSMDGPLKCAKFSAVSLASRVLAWARAGPGPATQ